MSEKILIIPAIDFIGGPENRLHRIISEWKKRIHVYVFWFPLTAKVKRAPQCTLLKPPTILHDNVLLFYMLNLLPHSFFLLRTLLRDRFSLVLIAHPLYGIPVIIIAKIKKIPVIFDLQDDLVDLARMYSPHHHFSSIVSLSTFFALFIVIRTSNIVVAVSRTLADFAAKFNPNVVVVPNGVNVKLFKPELFRLNNGRKIVGYIGSLDAWSGVRQALSEVVDKVIKSDPNVEFHIYGNGSEAYIVKQFSQKESSIKYFGEIPYKEIPNVIRTFTIGLIPFLRCSITDKSCPMKLFEYWAAGVPVISMNLENIKSICDDAVLLVNNYSDMANQIISLLSDGFLWNKLKRCGLARVMQYQWSEISSKLLEVIFSLIEDYTKR